MALTRDFKETVQARAKVDATFREGLLNEGVQCLLDGELDAGKILLRDYINATIGFEGIERSHQQIIQELDADVWAKWKPTSQESFRRDIPNPRTRGCASRS